MHTIPRPLALFVAAAASVLAACVDSTAPKAAPAPDAPAAVRARFVCTASVRNGTVSCADAAPGGAASKDRILGDQGVNTRIVTGAPAVTADTFAFALAVTNLLRAPIGTTDGTTPDSDGVRVFIADGITATQGAGTVTAVNADGVGVFTAAGQPYYAYHQIIQADSTSQARSWRFRFDPGVESFSFRVYVNAPVPPGGGRVYLTALAPAAHAYVGDSMRVSARIDSARASISSVQASAAGRTVVLHPTAPATVGGTLYLGGLPSGPLQVVIAATAMNGDTGSVVVPVTRDLPPTLTVASPHNGAAANPGVRIDADCADDMAACKSVTAQVGLLPSSAPPSTTVASGTTGIHATTASLGAYDGRYLRLQITAADSAGQTAVRNFLVAVDTSSHLAPALSAGDAMLDLDAGRVLTGDEPLWCCLGGSYLPWAVWIHDRSTGDSTRIATQLVAPTGTAIAYQGWLHTNGAFVYSQGFIYDWNAGTLTSVRPVTTPQVKGDWAAYTVLNTGTSPVTYQVTRRDLAAGTSTVVATNGTGLQNPVDVAPNGDVVWTGTDYNIYRYRSSVEQLTTGGSAGGTRYEEPVTDGTNVAYHRDADADLLLWTPGGTVDLGTLGQTSQGPGLYGAHYAYEVNNGWTAFLRTDGGGLSQVWVRSPTGEVRQATSTGQSASIRALGPGGEVVFTIGSRTYATRYPYASATNVSTSAWTIRFKGAQLYEYVGRTAFTVGF